MQREETVGNYAKDYLIQMVKDNLDKLGIPYDEKPGGFGSGRMIDPGVFTGR